MNGKGYGKTFKTHSALSAFFRFQLQMTVCIRLVMMTTHLCAVAAVKSRRDEGGDIR